MIRLRIVPWLLALTLQTLRGEDASLAPLEIAGYSPDCGIEIRAEGERVIADWPLGDGETGRILLDRRPLRPLIAALAIGSGAGTLDPLLSGVDPVFILTVGSREQPPGRPPSMSVFNVFFDNPHQRPHTSHLARLERRAFRVSSEGKRARIAAGELIAGPFRGELRFTLYTGSRLVHVEAVLTTQEERRAFIYDAGIAGENPGARTLAWMDTEGEIREEAIDPSREETARNLAVRHRAIFAAGERGAVAAFPPPHQFQFPRDLTDNLKFVWAGRGYGKGRGAEIGEGGLPAWGFGIRQNPSGGGNFVPWFNAPPGTAQRLGFFLLPARGAPRDALAEVLRYTRGDRFPALPGQVTFSSHWHMAIAVAALAAKRAGRELGVPDFVRMFKGMGVSAVHLAEFHGDGHPKDPGPQRLEEMEAMFAECRRLSDRELLLLPGEEENEHLGIAKPGQHPGHWMSLFPRPVLWTQVRAAEGQPFLEDRPALGPLYHVGSRADAVELLRRERGLAWSAHPRIKASSWAPDAFRGEDFFHDPLWLGAAWKAMPADLSRERLGERALDLLDDLSNWGERKYLVGEVDVFKIDHTHELYGHLNINYLRLERLPRYEEGWEPILDALRRGAFFVTTGEILLRSFTVGGKASGEELPLPADGSTEVSAEFEWTFPMRFAELISGDGASVHRDRIDLSGTLPFGRRTLAWRADLRGRRWARVEAWDIAADGAFSQPVWIGRK